MIHQKSYGMKEIWKTIPFEPSHEVSNLGRFRNKISVKRWGIRIRNGCLTKKGYLRIRFNSGKVYMAHRIVAEVFIPKTDPTKTEVNHKNFYRTDNKVSNLEWVSHSENIGYSIKSGNYHNRLTKRYVKEVKNLTTGETFESISQAAQKYNTSYGAIKHSVLGHNRCRGCDWRYTGNKNYILLQTGIKKQIKNKKDAK